MHRAWCGTVIAAVLVGTALTVSCIAPGRTPLAQRAGVTIRITPEQVIHDNLLGIGVNMGHSDYRYCEFRDEFYAQPPAGEWGVLHSQPFPFPQDEAEWANWFELFDFCNFQWVRVGTHYVWWEPENDNDDPQAMNQDDGFIWTPGYQEKHPDSMNVIYLNQLYRMDAVGCASR